MNFNPRRSSALAICGALVGCGVSAVGDPNSQQLVYIGHAASAPIASLAIYEAGSYRLLDEQSRSEVAGQLEAAELRQVQAHADQGSIADLVANQVDGNRCVSDELAFWIISKFGNACIVSSEISDPSIRAHADFFIALFSAKAPKP